MSRFFNRRTVVTVSGTVGAAALTLALVAQMLISDRAGQAFAAEDSAASGQTATPPIRVETIRASRQALTRTLRMPATLVPYESADLYAKTSGYVETVNVDIGSRVKRGDPLLTIDVPEMMDDLNQAQAVLSAKQAKVRALESKVTQAEAMIVTARAEVGRYVAEEALARLTHERQEALRRENAISAQVFDEVQSRVAVAEAQLTIAKAKISGATAQKQADEADVAAAQADVAVERAGIARIETLMKYATIRAPFEGVITSRNVDPGAFVRSAAEGMTTPLLSIAKVDRLRLVLEIPESDTTSVTVGTALEIVVKAVGAAPMQATIARTAGALKATTRTMRVEADLDNADGRLAPGMYAIVVVTLQTQAAALMIPARAIRQRGRESAVLVIRDGVARSVPIQIGYDDGIDVEVVKGLQGDEQIIVAAPSIVAPGTPVEPVEAASSGV